MQQKHVEKTHGLAVDAHDLKRVQVHQSHFHVFHTALTQCMQRALASKGDALGANGAVKLVFNLQQRGGQLFVDTICTPHTHRLVGRIGLGQRAVQRVGVPLQAVVAHGQRGLRITLVAQAAHAQRGGIGQIHGAFTKRLQLVLATRHKRGAHCRRSAKQIQ